MWILGIDTSSQGASLGLVKDGMAVAECRLSYSKDQLKSLLPEIKHICEGQNITVSDLEVAAVTTGPGSFTGIRLGLGTVQGLKDAVGLKAVGVSTLFALSFPLLSFDFPVCSCILARPGEAYMGIYRRNEEVKVVVQEQAVSLDALKTYLNQTHSTRIILTGNAVPLVKEMMQNRQGIIYAEPWLWNVCGFCVAFAAMEKNSSSGLAPNYVRKLDY